MEVETSLARGRQVGVDLHGLIQFEGEIGGQTGEPSVAVLQALQDHSVPQSVSLDDRIGIDHVAQASVPKADRSCDPGAPGRGAGPDQTKGRLSGATVEEVAPKVLAGRQ